jgi:hypothetical protein
MTKLFGGDQFAIILFDQIPIDARLSHSDAPNSPREAVYNSYQSC